MCNTIMTHFKLLGALSCLPSFPRDGKLIIPKESFSFSKFPRVDAPSFSPEGHAHGGMQHFVVDNEGYIISGYGLLVEHRVDPDSSRPLAVAAEGPFSNGAVGTSGAPCDRGLDRASEVFFVDFPL